MFIKSLLQILRHRRFQAAAGAALLVFVLFILGGGLWRLSHPSKENLPLSLYPSRSAPLGWSYQIEQQNLEPLWDEAGFFGAVPANTPGAVTASRTISEETEEGMLHFMPAETGLQVFLDGEILYTDYPRQRNDPTLPLSNEEANLERFSRQSRSIYVSLPKEYLGRTLTVVTYCPALYGGGRVPCFPMLCSEMTLVNPYVADSVLPLFLGTTAALLTIFLLLLYLSGVWNSTGDPSILLLALFSFFCIFTFTRNSWPVTNSFGQDTWFFQYASTIYADILLLFLASHMRRRSALILSLTAVLHILLQLVLSLLFSAFFCISRDMGFILVFLLAAVMLFIERKQQPLFRSVLYALLPLGAALAAGTAAQYARFYNYIGMTVQSASNGNWAALKQLICTYLAFICVVSLTVDYVHRRIHQRLAAQSIQLRTDYTAENIAALEQSLEEVRQARHEYLHHLDAMSALCRQKDYDRLEAYLQSVSGSLDRDTPLRYSENSLVNAVVSSRFHKAKRLGIRTRAQVQLPAQLPLEDTDLTVLLANILDNALEAAARVPDPPKRRVILKIGIFEEHTLFIGCENSAVENAGGGDKSFRSTKPDHENHGYGLEAIRRITRKYSGTLVLRQENGCFFLKACLRLPAPGIG